MRVTGTSVAGKRWLCAAAVMVCGLWCTAGIAEEAAAEPAAPAEAAAPGSGAGSAC